MRVEAASDCSNTVATCTLLGARTHTQTRTQNCNLHKTQLNVWAAVSVILQSHSQNHEMFCNMFVMRQSGIIASNLGTKGACAHANKSHTHTHTYNHGPVSGSSETTNFS